MDNDLIANCHLLPLNIDDHQVDSDSNSENSSIDSDIEVDDSEHVNDDFIRLNLSTDDNNSEDEVESLTYSSDNEEVIYLQTANTSSTLTTTTTTPNSATTVTTTSISTSLPATTTANNSSATPTTTNNSSATPTTTNSTHKRRQWTLKEKMKILSEHNKGASLHKLELKYKCTRKMIREWKKNENELIKLLKEKGTKSKKRKRIGGAGAKLLYPDLDEHLIGWYRSKRGLDQEGIHVHKERVTFKGMVRQRQRFSAGTKSKEPSKKWYTRFLKRHRLSLQRPVRKQKIYVTKAQVLIENFHRFIRKASHLGPRRGCMGCFTESDVCNMDESPLNLWGDQSKRCINDINSKNEIEGHLDDKRFATVILCVFPEGNHRIKPVLLFKGTGKVAVKEEQHYSSHVKVFFTPKSVINIPTMEKYINWWLKNVKDGNRKLFITDSCNSHLNDNLTKKMRDNGVCLAIIPKGCTQYIQLLDVHVFSAFKNHYYDCAEEYLELNGPRLKLKLSSSQKRILCTRLTAAAWYRTLKSIDLQNAFRSLGYTWVDNSIIQPNHISWYKFDPNSIESNQEEAEDQNHEAECDERTTISTIKIQNKQLTLKDMWKNK
ncbi:unnamed protein product [Rotaria sordida]|uniref:DDE-1 domain-containing protein n=1 Tax=Rotaria sordida TaxID=392033 RepID=A0A815UNR3_9BILA|nr:unnamed protein product [Rotaria sordida]CAF1662450.1 unnamed protein product [Rotaria sordida]